MRLKVDEAGRVILPKPIRDRLGLEPGSDVEAEETPDGVLLRHPSERSSMVRTEDGLWVYAGEVPPGFDAVKAVAEDRDERIRKLAGL